MNKENNCLAYVEYKNDIKYIIKPQDKIVIGIYQGSVLDYIDDFIIKSLNVSEFHCFNAITNFDKIEGILGAEIKAIARCSDEDVFDAEFGKRLVEARIYRKIHKKIIDIAENFFINLKKLECKVYEFEFNHRIKINSIDRDLREYFHVEY